MLNVNTLPNRKDEELMFDECSQLRSRSKRTEEGKNIFKTNVSSQKIRMKKEEGATVAASHLPSLSWPFHHQAGPAAFPRKHSTLQESPIKSHKRNETPAIFSFQLIGSPIQMNN